MTIRQAAQSPRRRPQQQRSRATVEKILVAAAQVFSEEGVAATTDRIAIRAGVSVGSLYQYFPNKEALLVELARRHMEEATGVFQYLLRPGRPSAQWLPEAASALAAQHADGHLHRVLYIHATTTPALRALFEQMETMLCAKVCELLVTEARFTHPEITARVLVALGESLTHRLAGTMDPAILAREVARAAIAYLEASATADPPSVESGL